MILTIEEIDDFIAVAEKGLLAKLGNPAAHRATIKTLRALRQEITKQESYPVVPTPPPSPPPGSRRTSLFRRR